MDDRDRALLAEIAERDRDAPADDLPLGIRLLTREERDRRHLLRIVGQLEHLLRERDTLAEDLADDAAAERATESRWGR